MPKIQEWIYQLEEGRFGRIFQIVVLGAGIAVLAVIFHLREYSNLSHPSAMDIVQVGRNLSQGEGYTTKNVRPFAIYMIDRQAAKKGEDNQESQGVTYTETRQMLESDRFPDVTHPPLYPAILSVVFNILPFQFELDPDDPTPFINSKYKYQPEAVLSILQTLLFVVTVALTYLIALQLFDNRIALLSAIVMLLHAYFWETLFSGLPTLILVNLTLLLGFFVSVVVGKWENLASTLASQPAGAPLDTKEDFLHSVILMVLAGATIGIGGLADYSFLWFLVPVIGISLFSAPRWKPLLAIIPFLVALIIMAPWFLRNMNLTGNPFGLAGYSIFQSTQLFPYNSLDMQLNPDSSDMTIDLIAKKFMMGIHAAIDSSVNAMGGLVMVSFFLVGYFIPFRSARLNNLRYWVGVAVVLYVMVSAVVYVNYGETHSSATPYELAAWLSPFVVIFAVACFYVLTDQIQLEPAPLQRVFPVIFAILAGVPLVWNVLPPHRFTALPEMKVPGRISAPDSPVVPYDIFKIQYIGQLFRAAPEGKREEPDSPVPVSEQAEMIMTDMPWAYAWYADRPCFLLTATQAQEFEIHRNLKRVNGLYLTEMSMMKSFDEIFSIRNSGWSTLLREALLKGEVPNSFHMLHTPWPISASTANGAPVLANQIFLSTFPRW